MKTFWQKKFSTLLIRSFRCSRRWCTWPPSLRWPTPQRQRKPTHPPLLCLFSPCHSVLTLGQENWDKWKNAMHFQLFKIFRRSFMLCRNIYQIAEALWHGRAPFIDCPNNNNDTTMQGMALKRERGGRWEGTMAAHKVPGLKKFLKCVRNTFDFCFITWGP